MNARGTSVDFPILNDSRSEKLRKLVFVLCEVGIARIPICPPSTVHILVASRTDTLELGNDLIERFAPVRILRRLLKELLHQSSATIVCTNRPEDITSYVRRNIQEATENTIHLRFAMLERDDQIGKRYRMSRIQYGASHFSRRLFDPRGCE